MIEYLVDVKMKKGTKKVLLIIGGVAVVAGVAYLISKQNVAASLKGAKVLGSGYFISITPVLGGDAKITQMVVTDTKKGNVYTWSAGAWSPSTPQCYAGTNTLQIVITITNQGNTAADITIALSVAGGGATLKTQTFPAVAVGGVGIMAYTGDMPTSVYNLAAQSTP